MVCSLSPTTPVIADADTGYAIPSHFLYIFSPVLPYQLWWHYHGCPYRLPICSRWCCWHAHRGPGADQALRSFDGEASCITRGICHPYPRCGNCPRFYSWRLEFRKSSTTSVLMRSSSFNSQGNHWSDRFSTGSWHGRSRDPPKACS
jgi:hypothetical protein